MRRWLIPLVVILVALGAGGTAVAVLARGYTVSVMLPNAENLIQGGSVMRDGFQVGSIDRIDTENGKAKVTFSLDDESAPLHDGATVQVDWKAALGERLLTIRDGPAGYAAIPAGGLVQGRMPAPVEFDQVLAALDPATRERLNGLINNLHGTLEGSDGDVNRTLRTAGPALQQLGQITRSVDSDGTAIHHLVAHLNSTMGILDRRDRDVAEIVNSLGNTTDAVAGKREQVGGALRRLPGTLQRADSTLRDVPDMTNKTQPLLDDLGPAAAKLPSVAKNLRPVIADVRPTVSQLRPTLDSASQLLRYTPGLLDNGSATAPGADTALSRANPALDFVRPYAPDIVGWLSNWGSAAANYDANGHMARFLIQTGAEAANVNPGITTPGVRKVPAPPPGQLAQSGSDAYGGGMR